MEPADYQTWLSGGARRVAGQTGAAAVQRARLHHLPLDRRAGPRPVLEGIFGKHVQLADGGTVDGRRAYLRESILKPQAKIVAGSSRSCRPSRG